jgi:hypothetical protein
MVTPYCYRKLRVITMLLHRHIVIGNCMVSSHCYWKMGGIVILLQKTACYRHIVTGKWVVSSCCYRKPQGIVKLRFNCAIWKGYWKLQGVHWIKNLQKIIEMWDNALHRVHAENKGSCWCGTTRCILFLLKLQDRADAGQRAVSCSYRKYRIVLMWDNALYPVRTENTGSCWCGRTRCILFLQKLQDRVDAECGTKIV